MIIKVVFATTVSWRCFISLPRPLAPSSNWLRYFFCTSALTVQDDDDNGNDNQCLILAPGDGSYNGDSPTDLGSGNVDRWKIFVSPENICRRVGARPLHQLPHPEQYAGGGAPRQHREAALQGPQAAQQCHGQWICIAFYHSFNNWIQMFPFCFCVPKD